MEARSCVKNFSEHIENICSLQPTLKNAAFKYVFYFALYRRNLKTKAKSWRKCFSIHFCIIIHASVHRTSQLWAHHPSNIWNIFRLLLKT